MKRIFLNSILLLTFAAVSCNRTAAPEIPDDGRIAFTLGGAVMDAVVSTRATVVNKASLEASGIQVAAATGTAGSADVEVWNAPFAKSGTVFAGDKYWPISNPGYHFYSSNVALTRDAAGKGYTVAASNATDVVCAYLASPVYKATNTLTYSHVFARLGDVTVTAAPNYTISAVNITVVPLTGGTYNLFTGNGKTDGTGWSATSAGSATAIANATPGTKANDIWLVPGTYELTATWTATRGNYTETFTAKKKTVALTAGKVNKITTTLGGNAEEVLFSVDVVEWSDVTVPVEFDI